MIRTMQVQPTVRMNFSCAARSSGVSGLGGVDGLLEVDGLSSSSPKPHTKMLGPLDVDELLSLDRRVDGNEEEELVLLFLSLVDPQDHPPPLLVVVFDPQL